MTKIKVHDPTTGKMIEVEVPVKKCPPSPRDWVQHVQTNWREEDSLRGRLTLQQISCHPTSTELNEPIAFQV